MLNVATLKPLCDPGFVQMVRSYVARAVMNDMEPERWAFAAHAMDSLLVALACFGGNPVPVLMDVQYGPIPERERSPDDVRIDAYLEISDRPKRVVSVCAQLRNRVTYPSDHMERYRAMEVRHAANILANAIVKYNETGQLDGGGSNPGMY